MQNKKTFFGLYCRNAAYLRVIKIVQVERKNKKYPIRRKDFAINHIYVIFAGMKFKSHILYIPVLLIIISLGAICSCSDSTVYETEIDTKPELTEPEPEQTEPAPDFYNTSFAVLADNKYIPVYTCKIAPENAERRWKAMDDIINSKLYYDTAAFAYFGLKESGADIKIYYPEKINTVKILPSSAAIASSIQDNSVSFHLDKPANLTIEINGNHTNSLHLFANPPETDIPDENDPNVIYFGPGTHELSNLHVRDNQTVYIAEGAIIKGVIDPNEPSFYHNDGSGLKGYSPLINIIGKNIIIRGRGIIDCENIPTHGKNTLRIWGENITVEGIIMTNPSVWTMPIVYSRNVNVNNVKILGHRTHSDGIDICSSHNVTVDGCFIRTLDDLVVVKVLIDDGEFGHIEDRTAGDIVVKNCVLWNQVAHALSIGAEITDDVTNVLFENCDVVHDIGREHTLRIFHSDAATVRNITFNNIRIEESKRLISLWIGESYWSSDAKRGNIKDVTFSNISAFGNPLRIEFKGGGPDSKIDNVMLKNITLNNNPLLTENIIKSGTVTNITVTP